MNYWPALSTNLAECAEPLTDFIRLLEKPGERTAKAYWGARGWAAGISANIFGFTAPLEGADMSWNYNPMAASWLATHLWDYYDYTRDADFHGLPAHEGLCTVLRGFPLAQGRRHADGCTFHLARTWTG